MGRPRFHQRRWEKCATITLTILPSHHISYKSLNNLGYPQLSILTKQHPSILLNSSSFTWGTVKSTSSPANPSCKLRRTCWHSSEGITFAAEFSAVHLWPVQFFGPCQLLWRRNLWRQVPLVQKPDHGRVVWEKMISIFQYQFRRTSKKKISTIYIWSLFQY